MFLQGKWTLLGSSDVLQYFANVFFTENLPGIMAPTPPAMITPAPSERDSQRTIFPLTLPESRSPGRHCLYFKEIELAEKFVASPPQINGNGVPLRSKLLMTCPYNDSSTYNQWNEETDSLVGPRLNLRRKKISPTMNVFPFPRTNRDTNFLSKLVAATVNNQVEGLLTTPRSGP